jgi:CubicO group peptidase (beta-lactamase class C family)
MSTTSGGSRRRFLKFAAAAGASALGATTTGASTARAATFRADDLSVTGIEQPAMTSFDELMRDFVREHQVVGASLAVTKDARLVYARGFGLADRDQGEPVEPASLFRIASLSKPITGAAIVQLVERKVLALDNKVCEVLALQKTMDPRWHQISIRQLLHHTGGWDRDKSFDPMFRSVKIAKNLKVPPPAMPEHIIHYMTAERLDFDPGNRYVYSNFGYSLLGRVIERVGGAPYGEYVRRQVLAPLGISRMQLGATLAGGRRPHEVRYYDRQDRTGPSVMGPLGEQVPLPYGTWCLEAMDAHGGWLASAIDLVRFAAALDRPEQCKILKPASIETLFARPSDAAGHKEDGGLKDVYYACGWNVRQVGRNGGHNTWHTGALDGTSTLMVRRHDGVNWAVLFNNRKTENGKELAGTIDPLVHRAADKVTHWPDQDQFGQFGVS